MIASAGVYDDKTTLAELAGHGLRGEGSRFEVVLPFRTLADDVAASQTLSHLSATAISIQEDLGLKLWL